MRKTFKLVFFAAAVSLLAATAGFAAADRSQAKDTFVFAAEGDPVLIDGAFVSDGPSLRIVFQIFEGLVRNKPGTGQIEPLLATSWKASPNGRIWTFNLRKGVKFSDGTPFNAAAVCTNFNRQYNLPPLLQGEGVNYYWFTVFGGYAKPGPGNPGPDKSLYHGCKRVNDSTARIILKRRSSSFLGALALANFAIASPAALKQYKADEGTVGSDGVFRAAGTFGTQNPVGTGPYKLESWRIGDRLVLVRNDGYWGTKAKTRRVIVRPITDNTARLQALQTGEVDAINLVQPQDISTIRSNSSLKILDRHAFNIGYVGMNQSFAPLNNIKVRQAIAHGLDRKSVVGSFYGGRGTLANQFLPPGIQGYAQKGVPDYPYDPDRAKQLLRESGLTLPVPIEFWYPTDRPRGYMPDPPRNFQAFAASLEKSGFKVTPHPAPWRSGYVSGLQSGKAALYLFGWTGDFVDPANFLNVHFGAKGSLFGFNNPKIFTLLTQADEETNADKRAGLYQKASVEVMKFLPMVPYANSKPALGFKKNVTGYVTSPVELESFATVVVG
ncbi:MAG: ABC transporter substrate-binding protein [Gaiella sp.]